MTPTELWIAISGTKYNLNSSDDEHFIREISKRENCPAIIGVVKTKKYKCLYQRR